MPRLPRYWPIVAVFVAMTILQASVAAFSIQLLSTVRAYVAGESLYSKAQKDAQIYLLDYAEKQDEADYARFMSALAIPLGDRAAREALQQRRPDVEAARRGFAEGGNHPDDIDGLIRMFRWFQHVPFMSRPIATWTEGDRTIQEMRELVDRARDRIRAGETDAPAVQAMRLQSPVINERLTGLTSAFSSQLGEASRTTQRLLLGLNTTIAVLLMISGLGFVRRAIRMQAAADLRMERLIHAVTEGVVTIDEQRRIVLFNRAAETLFGVPATDALGSTIDRFIESLPASAGAAPGEAPAAGALQALTGRKRNGRSFPIEASLSRLQTEQGALTTIVLRDITVRIIADAERRAHEALEASSRAKTEFLSRMSHELRTPLNAVIGFSKLLRLDTVKPLSTEQLERVQHVENAGAHLLALVNDVLDLSRIESGEMSVSTQAVQLLRVIEEAATMVSPLVTKAGIEVFVAAEPPAPGARPRADTRPVPDGDLWVSADPVRLRQVLVNLLSNAVKYNRPGGSVALTWKRGACELEIQVTDTGQGIPPEQLAGLFQPFNRLGAETSTVEGTGIGLVLSRQLTEMMGGTLTVASTFGVGTCASLKLSLACDPATMADSVRMARAAESRAHPTLTVLYAEDDEVNAELVRQLVTMRRGVSLRVATSGAMALECARADPPDLMLVDMNLGDMTGLELARELRRDRATRNLCLIALSADALPEQIRAAMEFGFESYLTKPINFEEVLAVLDAHSQEAFA